jgi:manganese oxidase
MHLHNNRQLAIAKDGFPLESSNVADTLDVAPGERYPVLVLA